MWLILVVSRYYSYIVIHIRGKLHFGLMSFVAITSQQTFVFSMVSQQEKILIVALWCHMPTYIWVNLAQIMAWYLMAPSHYLHQCWFIIRGVLWDSYESCFVGSALDMNMSNELANYTLKITATSPRDQWVNECEKIYKDNMVLWPFYLHNGNLIPIINITWSHHHLIFIIGNSYT